MTDHEKAIEAAARAMWQRHMQIVWEGGEAPICEWEELPPSQRASQRDLIASAITAYLAALGEAGSVVVPVEPSAAMIDAFVSRALQVSIHGEGGWSEYGRNQWQQMLAARPRIAEAKE